MFVGENKKAKGINLLLYTKNEIETMKKEEWFCPSCKKKLIVKNGKVVVSHFAHQSNTSCYAFSEGETEEHLKGKKLLAKWCEQNKIIYELEAYLPEIAQRPDLLINQKIAVEFQCSSLSIQRLIERTKQYQEYGYEVIWIVGKSFFLKEKLSALQRGFISFHQNIGFYLWQLDVEEQILLLHYHIEKGWSKGDVYSGIKKWKVGTGKLGEVLSYPKTSRLFHKRSHQVEAKIEEIIYKVDEMLWRKDNRIMPLQAYCYQRGINVRLLDMVYYLPVTSSLSIQDNEVLWRLQFIEYLEERTTCDIFELVDFFLQKIRDNKLTIYSMPMISKQVAVELFVKDYTVVLLKLGYINMKRKQLVLLKKTVCYKSVEERDLDFRKKLKSIKQISATPQRNMLS